MERCELRIRGTMAGRVKRKVWLYEDQDIALRAIAGVLDMSVSACLRHAVTMWLAAHPKRQERAEKAQQEWREHVPSVS